MDFLITIANFIVVIGFLILIHEGGHFLAARWAGVWVHEFAVGFGPAIWKRKTLETLYALRIFPIGGYVRMAGETVTSAESGRPEGEDETDVPQDRLFSEKSAWARMGIIVAGPVTNVVGAVLLTVFAVAVFGASFVEVVRFTADDSPAAQALQVGDIITRIDDTSIYNTGQISSIVSNNGDRALTVSVLRNGEPMDIEITPKWMPEQGQFLLGAFFSIARTNVITRVDKNSFLGQHGVQPQDRITALNGIAINSFQGLSNALEDLGSDLTAATVTFQRNDKKFEVAIDLAATPWDKVFQGISVETPTRSLGLLESVRVGFGQTVGMAVGLYNGIRSIVRGEISAGEAFSGPVGIANILNQGRQQGWSAFFYLVAFLSLNLGIINLLPFPALDGSRLVFITIELVRGKPISPEREGLVHQVGFFLLLGLILLITFNDIRKLFI